jgi:hypothetical protein
LILQTTLSVEFTPVDANTTYMLQWKVYPVAWDSASLVSQMELNPGTKKAQATDLEPGTTYCIRLVDKGGLQQPGPELVLDTEQVGCTPKANKSCCIVQ